MLTSVLYNDILLDLSFPRSFTCCNNHFEFICPTILLWLENTVFIEIFTTSGYYDFFSFAFSKIHDSWVGVFEIYSLFSGVSYPVHVVQLRISASLLRMKRMYWLRDIIMSLQVVLILFPFTRIAIVGSLLGPATYLDTDSWHWQCQLCIQPHRVGVRFKYRI